MIQLNSTGLCTCDCGTPCPLGKAGMETRCTRKELEAVGIECSPSNKEMYGDSTWNIQVNRYYQALSGERWRMSYDDDFICDFDHEPTMKECMKALIIWWRG